MALMFCLGEILRASFSLACSLKKRIHVEVHVEYGTKCTYTRMEFRMEFIVHTYVHVTSEIPSKWNNFSTGRTWYKSS